MSAASVDTDRLKPFATAIVGAFIAAGKTKPVLPEGRREEVVALLTRLMVNPGMLDAYCEAVTAERERQGVHRLLFERGDEPIPDREIARRGLGWLPDDQLADLAIDAHALRALAAELLDSPDLDDDRGSWFFDAAAREQADHPDDAEQARRLAPFFERIRQTVLTHAPPVPPLSHEHQESSSGRRPPIVIILLAHPTRRATAAQARGDAEATELAGTAEEWGLTTPDGQAEVLLPAEVAQRCFGTAEQRVTFRLVRAAAGPGMFEPQLAVTPPPRNASLTVRLTFADGSERALTIPASRRKGPGWSQPCQPLPPVAFGGSGWNVQLDLA